MGGVDYDVQAKVEQFGEDEVLGNEAGNGTLVNRSRGSGFGSSGSLVIGVNDRSIGLFNRHVKSCSLCTEQGVECEKFL
jgi:hypothetical protein